MQTNTARKIQAYTHGGVPAVAHISPEAQLRRAVLSCLLWESEYYESGQSIADRICDLCAINSTQTIAALAVEARSVHNLRHVPLLLLTQLAKYGRGQGHVAQAITNTIQRADELAEFLSLYWRAGKCPISKQVKKGLAEAFPKFSAYQLAKYNREKEITLRDVMFMVHPKPKDAEQAEVWKQLVDGTLPSPDTWEVALSGGADKKETFERLLTEGNLGYLALLRNLRNMDQTGVDRSLVEAALMARRNGADKVLPFRYIAAARAAPSYARQIDAALLSAISELPVLPGRTLVLVDVSGSMVTHLSSKSDLSRMDAAAGLAALINGDVRVFSFSEKLVEVPAWRGLAGVDGIIKSQSHGGTALAAAVAQANQLPHDRLIVITDEQATDSRVVNPVVDKAYMINVASYKNGVGYGKWTHLDGFSESVIRWIHEFEKEG